MDTGQEYTEREVEALAERLRDAYSEAAADLQRKTARLGEKAAHRKGRAGDDIASVQFIL